MGAAGSFSLRILPLCLLLIFPATEALGFPLSDENEDRARKLEAQLMAPCCYTGTIAQHQSQIARKMRAEVREMIAEGSSDQQILDTYVARYGQRILASPPAEGFYQWLYYLPPAVVAGLLALACLVLWHWYRRAHPRGRHA